VTFTELFNPLEADEGNAAAGGQIEVQTFRKQPLLLCRHFALKARRR